MYTSMQYIIFYRHIRLHLRWFIVKIKLLYENAMKIYVTILLYGRILCYKCEMYLDAHYLLLIFFDFQSFMRMLRVMRAPITPILIETGQPAFNTIPLNIPSNGPRYWIGSCLIVTSLVARVPFTCKRHLHNFYIASRVIDLNTDGDLSLPFLFFSSVIWIRVSLVPLHVDHRS